MGYQKKQLKPVDGQNTRQVLNRKPDKPGPQKSENLTPVSNRLEQITQDPGLANSQDILALQRVAGNQGVSHLIQTKLTVGAAHDPYEQEADQVASQVMAMPDPQSADPAAQNGVQRASVSEEDELQAKPISSSISRLQRSAAPEEEEIQTKALSPSISQLQRDAAPEEEEIQTKALSPSTSQLQRDAAPEEEEIQTKPDLMGSFEAGPDIEGRINTQQGSGSPLPGELRSFMEPRFGADFSGVRVHTGSEPAAINRSLSAQAFTHGKDIYLGEGHEDIESSAGKSLMAHELAHVVQQTGSQAPAGAQRLQRLALINTGWAAATSATVSEGGGTGGVLIISDGSSGLVVKPGQDLAPEIILSAAVSGAAFDAEGTAGNPDSYSLTTPSARIASLAEAAAIKTKATQLLGPKAADKKHQRVLNNLDSPTTVIFNMAGGQDMDKLLKNMRHSDKKTFSRNERKAKKDSPLIKMVSEPGALIALGKAGALDVFMGNGDRTIGKFNPENWRTDSGSHAIHLIDNVENSPGAYFVQHGPHGSPREGFEFWLQTQYVKQFARGQFPEIAQYAIDRMEEHLFDLAETPIQEEDKAFIRQLFRTNKSQMVAWFASGLENGKRLLLTALGYPPNLVAGIPQEQRKEALISILARRYVLNGWVDIAAWERAEDVVNLAASTPGNPAPPAHRWSPARPNTTGRPRR